MKKTKLNYEIKDGHAEFLSEIDFNLNGKLSDIIGIINALAFIKINKTKLLDNQHLFENTNLLFDCEHCNRSREKIYWNIVKMIEVALQHRKKAHIN